MSQNKNCEDTLKYFLGFEMEHVIVTNFENNNFSLQTLSSGLIYVAQGCLRVSCLFVFF